MTRAVFSRRDGLITGFTVTGHCTADCEDEAGRIACAAVSSAAYMTANTLTDVVGAEADIEVEDGWMRLSLTSDPIPCQDVLKGFHLHMRQLAAENEHQIEVLFGGAIHVKD